MGESHTTTTEVSTSQVDTLQNSTPSSGAGDSLPIIHEKERPAGEEVEPSRRGWAGWLNESVTPQSMVPILVLQAWATGVLDATTYADFNTFASNQTGNVILLTLSAVGTTKILLLLTGVSLAGFLGGAFVFGHLGHLFGVRRRAWLLLTTTLQFILLLTTLLILRFAPPSYQPQESTSNNTIATVESHGGGDNQFLILFFFALMSGAQVVMARQSSCQELPTAPMTSPMVDLVSDRYLFSFGPRWRRLSGVGNAGKHGGRRRSSVSCSGTDVKNNTKPTEEESRKLAIASRNRRLAYILSMVSGSFIGAVLHRYAGSWVVVLLSTVCKICAVVMLGFARADRRVGV